MSWAKSIQRNLTKLFEDEDAMGSIRGAGHYEISGQAVQHASPVHIVALAGFLLFVNFHLEIPDETRSQ